MAEVQNVGAMDYAQYQPSQYQPSQYQEDAYVEDYNAQPVIYDEQMAEQANNKSRVLPTVLMAAAGIGIGLGCYFWGKHGKVAKSELETVKKKLCRCKKRYRRIRSIF